MTTALTLLCPGLKSVDADEITYVKHSIFKSENGICLFLINSGIFQYLFTDILRRNKYD